MVVGPLASALCSAHAESSVSSAGKSPVDSSRLNSLCLASDLNVCVSPLITSLFNGFYFYDTLRPKIAELRYHADCRSSASSEQRDGTDGHQTGGGRFRDGCRNPPDGVYDALVDGCDRLGVIGWAEGVVRIVIFAGPVVDVAAGDVVVRHQVGGAVVQREVVDGIQCPRRWLSDRTLRTPGGVKAGKIERSVAPVDGSCEAGLPTHQF